MHRDSWNTRHLQGSVTVAVSKMTLVSFVLEQHGIDFSENLGTGKPEIPERSRQGGRDVALPSEDPHE